MSIATGNLEVYRKID